MGISYKIKSYCRIKNNKIMLNNTVVFENKEQEFLTFIKSAYKALDSKYPKFFKMDRLSKLAFLAADVLLKNEALDTDKENNIAVILSNNASSLDTDRKHQKAIQNKEDYFPSPAVFVYTLPNICIGEISIKYKLFSENSFFIFESLNAEHLSLYSNNLLQNNKAEQVLCGWVELDGENYDAYLYLVSPNGEIEHTKNNIEKLYNI